MHIGASQWCALLLGAALSIAMPATATSHRAAQAGSQFDFDYAVSGDAVARPLQVFDDGKGKTYFQFRPGARVPVILLGRGSNMVVPSIEGPYHVVTGRNWEYTLVLDRSQAWVRHAGLVAGGQPTDPGGTGALAAGLLPPIYRASDRTSSSYATPTRGDIIEWVEPEQRVEHAAEFVAGTAVLRSSTRAMIKTIADRLAPGARVQILMPAETVSGKRLRSRIDALHGALRESGMAVDNVSVLRADEKSSASGPDKARAGLRLRWLGASRTPRSATSPERQPAATPAAVPTGQPLRSNFDLLASDKTISSSMRRWATVSGYDLTWEATMDVPVSEELTLDVAGFEEAASTVVQRLQAAGYPLKLTKDGPTAYRVSQRHSAR